MSVEDVVSVDLETTGLSPARDRIVEFSFVRQLPDGSRKRLTRLVNPVIPISERAQEVHKISYEMVQHQPRFAELAPEILAFLDDVPEGAILCGHNLLKFDLPMLQAELTRAGFKPINLAKFSVVDSLVIFRKMEPHTLAKAIEFYCPEKADTSKPSHRALADAEAALDVCLAQKSLYEKTIGSHNRHIAAFSASNGHPAPAIQSDIKTHLSSAFPSDRPSAANPSSVAMSELDADGRLTFGKHKGRTIAEVVASDRVYARWLLRTLPLAPHSPAFQTALARALTNS